MSPSAAPLGRDEIHVWFRNTEVIDAAALDRFDAVLSADERARRDRLRFDADRRDFVAAHGLLRQSLSRYADVAPDAWTFGAEPKGKPFVSGPAIPPEVGPLSFSLSHARGHVACAVARGLTVGLDVERTDRPTDIESLAGRYFSAAETAALLALDANARRARFFELWTLKEGLLKALGHGLSQPLSAATFELDTPGLIQLTTSIVNPAEWCFVLYRPLPAVSMAVAACVANRSTIGVVARDADGHGAPLESVARAL